MSDPSTKNLALEESFRDYAWNYFALHADQRIKAFHFYILLSTAIIGGFALLMKNGELYKWMAVFGALLVFFSFVFWKLDNRNRQLVWNGEAALEFLDAQHQLPDQAGVPHVLRIFTHEKVTRADLPLYPLMAGHFTYARCFRWVFLMFAIVGTYTSILCLMYGSV